MDEITKVFFLGALLAMNLMLIWHNGILRTESAARIRSLELRVTAMEVSQDVALREVTKATEDMVEEIYDLLGISKKKGAPKSPLGSVEK